MRIPSDTRGIARIQAVQTSALGSSEVASWSSQISEIKDEEAMHVVIISVGSIICGGHINSTTTTTTTTDVLHYDYNNV